MERSYSPRKAGEMLGVTTHTIQAWDRQGKIRCIRLPTGRRRIPESEIRRLLNTAEQRREAIYARVSSHNQKSDLNSQVKVLRNRAPEADLYVDIRSGLNFRRKDLLRLLDDVLNKKISKIYVTYEDRLARFGFDLLSWMCNKQGTEIVVVDGGEAISPQEELVQDLIAITTSFSAKLYGLRSHKTKKLLRTVKEVTLR